jgi:hypothetical protein
MGSVATIPDQGELVGAEQVIRVSDLRHRWAVVVGHDRRSWRFDCCI